MSHPTLYSNLTAIVAMDKQRGIGKDNQLLWHMPADLAHFKQLTLNQTILMGRKTYESIGRPLPNRTNIVLTRDLHFSASGVQIIHHWQEALTLANTLPHHLIIIGGAQIYRLFMPYVARLELTLIQHTFAADTFFPLWQENEWREISHVDHAPDEKNKYPYQFMTLERIHSPR